MNRVNANSKAQNYIVMTAVKRHLMPTILSTVFMIVFANLFGIDGVWYGRLAGEAAGCFPQTGSKMKKICKNPKVFTKLSDIKCREL